MAEAIQRFMRDDPRYPRYHWTLPESPYNPQGIYHNGAWLRSDPKIHSIYHYLTEQLALDNTSTGLKDCTMLPLFFPGHWNHLAATAIAEDIPAAPGTVTVRVADMAGLKIDEYVKRVSSGPT